MTSIDLIGWAAAGMRLRACLSASVAFIPYGAAANACACWRNLATRSAHWRRLVLMALVLAPAATPMAAPPNDAVRMHARAVELFRQGRFPEAYGRFIELANAGHPASARHALWMCEQGPTLFGSDWDCAPHELEEWARTAGVALPRNGMPQYVVPTGSTLSLRR